MFSAKVSGELFHWLPPPGGEYKIDLLRRQQLGKFEPEAA